MDVKIIAVVVGALLGGAISTASFYFKNRKEVREKINESLFQLLEVWSLIAIVRVASSDNFHSILIDRIKARFPHETIGEKEKSLVKEGMIKSLPLLTGMKASSFDNSFLAKYKASVNELAKIYPLLAFDLNRNQMLINFLSSLDKLASEVQMSEGDVAILDNARDFMLAESFEKLEADLMTLASSSGFKNKERTKQKIDRLKSRLNTMPNDIFDGYIEQVIAPAIQAHYDDLGIDNPNKESNKAMHATSV